MKIWHYSGDDLLLDSIPLFLSSPSFQLVRECREALQQAIEVRKFYYEKIEVISRGDPAKLEQVEGDIAPFEEDLRSVLEVSVVTWRREGSWEGGVREQV